MLEKIKKLKNNVKSEGFSYILHAIMWRIPKWLSYYNHSFLLTAPKPKIMTRKYPGYEVKIAEISDVDLISEPEIYPKEKMLRRLQKGDSCSLVVKDNNIIAIIWGITPKRIFASDCGAIITIEDDAWFVDGTFTVPEERYKGFHLTCFKSIHGNFALENRTRILGIIHADNEISIKAHRRMGFQIIGETSYWILCGISLCYYKKWPHKTSKFHIFIKRPPQNLDWV